MVFFFVKHNTSYVLRLSACISVVCSSLLFPWFSLARIVCEPKPVSFPIPHSPFPLLPPHDALLRQSHAPTQRRCRGHAAAADLPGAVGRADRARPSRRDRKSTRLNSSH